MRKLLLGVFAAGLAASVMAGTGGKKQADDRVPVRLAIHHADPWAVKAMLEGQNITQPEISTLLGTQGGSRGGAQQGAPTSPLLQDGYLVVNPTDNSLWWYPKRK